LNIKRGLKRIWIVSSVLVVVWVTGLTIQEFPEKPVYLYEGKNISKERLKKMKRLEYLSKKKHGKDYDYNKEKKKKYEKKRNVTLSYSLWGLGVLIFMWGLLYTGFWISSGFSSDKKKDENNE